MNRISGYNKTTTEIGIPPQTEVWNFYYGITGIEKATRIENGVQNLTIDYSTDTNGRILSADYNKTGGSTVRIVPVYDNYGNIIACKLDDGDTAKAVLINPNNGAIDTRYDPNDIDDPHSYRARNGFMSIGPLWSNNDDGTVYMQGHVVIPNPWGNVSTNGTTTITTVDTTDKDGGDEEEPCDGDCWSLRQAAICFRAEYYFYKEQLNNLLEGKPVELMPNEYLQMFIRAGKTPPSYEDLPKTNVTMNIFDIREFLGLSHYGLFGTWISVGWMKIFLTETIDSKWNSYWEKCQELKENNCAIPDDLCNEL